MLVSTQFLSSKHLKGDFDKLFNCRNQRIRNEEWMMLTFIGFMVKFSYMMSKQHWICLVISIVSPVSVMYYINIPYPYMTRCLEIWEIPLPKLIQFCGNWAARVHYTPLQFVTQNFRLEDSCLALQNVTSEVSLDTLDWCGERESVEIHNSSISIHAFNRKAWSSAHFPLSYSTWHNGRKLHDWTII